VECAVDHTSRIRAELGYRAPVSYHEGIKRTDLADRRLVTLQGSLFPVVVTLLDGRATSPVTVYHRSFSTSNRLKVSNLEPRY
jgi:hypothetical protein